MTVELRPLDAALRPGVLDLEVAPGQERFTSAPAATVALADAEAARESVVITLDGWPVGYFHLDRRSVPGAPAGPDVLGLRAFCIDRRAQGQGLARAALAALPAFVRERFPERRRVALTVNVDNPVAIAAYRRAGFADTGELYLGGPAGPQHVLVLDVGF